MRENGNSFTSLKRIRITTYSGPWQFARQVARQFARQFALLAHMDPWKDRRYTFFQKMKNQNRLRPMPKNFRRQKFLRLEIFFAHEQPTKTFFNFQDREDIDLTICPSLTPQKQAEDFLVHEKTG
jgi:hypothetical protein